MKARTLSPLKETTLSPMKAKTLSLLKARTLSPLKASSLSPMKARTLSPLKARTLSPMKDQGRNLGSMKMLIGTSTKGFILMRKQEVESLRGPLIFKEKSMHLI